MTSLLRICNIGITVSISVYVGLRCACVCFLFLGSELGSNLDCYMALDMNASAIFVFVSLSVWREVQVNFTHGPR